MMWMLRRHCHQIVTCLSGSACYTPSVFHLGFVTGYRMRYERKIREETALFAIASTLAVMAFGWTLRRLGKWLDGSAAHAQFRGSRTHDHPRAGGYPPTVHHPAAHQRHDHGPGKIITQPEYASRHERKYHSAGR